MEGEEPGGWLCSKLAFPPPHPLADEGLAFTHGFGLGLWKPESREHSQSRVLESRCRRRRPAPGLSGHGGVPSQATAAVMSSRRPRWCALLALSTTRFAASAALAHWTVHLATWSCVSESQTPSEQMTRALPLAVMSHVTVCTAGTAEMAAPTSASPIARQTAKPPG